MGITHSHVSAVPNDPAADVSSDEWNAEHNISLTKAELNAVVSDGNVQFVGDAPTAHTHPAADIADATAAGRAMITAADAAAQTAFLDEFTPLLAGLVPAGGLGGYFLSSNGVWTTTFLDNKFVLTDGTDPTKTGKFQVSGLTPDVQRQWNLPDADGTVALVGHTHTAANITDFAAAVAATAAVTANTAKVTNAAHTGDATGSTVLTLATVNSNVGSFGLAASVAQFVVNAKGLITSAVNVAIAIASTAITDATAAGRAMLTAATAAAQTALLDVFTSGAKGLAPASGGGTVNFLRADGSWAAPSGGGGGSPGGSTTQVQYNNAGAFGGASEVEIEGDQLRLDATTSLTAPAAGGVKLIGRTEAGRTVPAFLSQDGVARDLQTDLAQSFPWMLRGFCGQGAAMLIPSGVGNVAAQGTNTSVTYSPSTVYGSTQKTEYLVTVAATNAIASIDRNFQPYRQVTVGGAAAGVGGFIFAGKWGIATGATNATHRAMFGLITGDGRPTDVEPSTLLSGVFMGWDAADTNIQMMHNDGSGTCTKIDLGASFPVPSTDRSSLYELEMWSTPGTTQSVGYTVRDTLTGAVASGTITTNLPTTTTLLSFRSYMSAGGTSSVVGLVHSYVILDGYR